MPGADSHSLLPHFPGGSSSPWDCTAMANGMIAWWSRRGGQQAAGATSVTAAVMDGQACTEEGS